MHVGSYSLLAAALATPSLQLLLLLSLQVSLSAAVEFQRHAGSFESLRSHEKREYQAEVEVCGVRAEHAERRVLRKPPIVVVAVVVFAVVNVASSVLLAAGISIAIAEVVLLLVLCSFC